MDKKPSALHVLFNKHREVIMYLIFGVITTAVSWVSFSVCEKYIGLNLYYSGIVSWIVAVTVAFITNKLWVFDSKSWAAGLVFKEATTFYGGRAATGVLETLAVPQLVTWGFDATLFGVAGLPAKIFVSIVIVIANYFLSKFLSFQFDKKAK